MRNLNFGPLLVSLIFSLATSSCGSSSDAFDSITSLLSTLEIDDCYETEDEGYVPATSSEDDDTSETQQLEECKAALVEAFDVDGNGEVDTEIEKTALNEDITERKAAKKEYWESQGLDEEQGKKQGREKRKYLRAVAKEGCLDDFDADSDGSLSADEFTSCHEARKTERAQARQDLRCQADTEGECSRVPKAKVKELFQAQLKKRDDLLTELDPNNELDVSKAQAAKDTFESKRKARKQDRDGRVEDNNNKETSGRQARRIRGRFNR